MSNKVYQILTDKVLAMIDKGVAPWRKPWKPGMMPRNYDGRPYSGCNLFLMSILSEVEGWEVPAFLTFNQIKKLGGTLKEGEDVRSNPVFYWNWKATKVNKVTGDEEHFPLFLYFRVYNIAQVDGIKLPKWATSDKAPVDPLEACEAIIAGYKDGPTIKHGGTIAGYNPPLDLLRMPPRNDFESSEAYYSTFFHELGHSTGHKSRLNRKAINDPISYGSHQYSQEELVAELTATFLCSEAGIENATVIENSAAYLKGWWSKLKAEPKLFAMAAAQAVKAAKRVLGTAEEAATETEGEVAQAA